MFTGILITDGGPHPADRWALHVAEQLVPLDDVKIGNRPALALKLQLAVVEALTEHFAKAQEDEKSKLSVDPNHFQNPHDVDSYAAPIVAAVVGCAAGTPWEAHFGEPAVQEQIALMASRHIWDALHIERMWHADRNPDLAQGQAYKTQSALPVPSAAANAE